jgi:hypothetical protein
MDNLEWFHYWNSRLWRAVRDGDLAAEWEAIAYLYSQPFSS